MQEVKGCVNTKDIVNRITMDISGKEKSLVKNKNIDFFYYYSCVFLVTLIGI